MSDLGQRLKSGFRRAYAGWLRLTPGSRLQIAGPAHTVIWNDARLHKCRVTVTGENNRLEIGAGARLWSTHIQLSGRNLVCRIGARTRLRGGTYVLTDENSRLEIGDETTAIGPMFVAQGGRAILIGRDCMVAYGADIRCSDGHAIVDRATGECLNPASDVLIGNHVWLGIHSQILKGVTIGDDAIVAARSVVTRSVPGAAIVAGNPAKVIREGITWDRRRSPLG